MADLSRADVQRAVQDALHHLSNEVSHISHVVDGMNRVSRDVQALSTRLMNLELAVHQMQNTVANTLGHNPATDPQNMQLSQAINDLRNRFTAVEQFSRQLSEYLHDREAQDKEDTQYRTA